MYSFLDSRVDATICSYGNTFSLRLMQGKTFEFSPDWFILSHTPRKLVRVISESTVVQPRLSIDLSKGSMATSYTARNMNAELSSKLYHSRFERVEMKGEPFNNLLRLVAEETALHFRLTSRLPL